MDKIEFVPEKSSAIYALEEFMRLAETEGLNVFAVAGSRSKNISAQTALGDMQEISILIGDFILRNEYAKYMFDAVTHGLKKMHEAKSQANSPEPSTNSTDTFEEAVEDPAFKEGVALTEELVAHCAAHNIEGIFCLGDRTGHLTAGTNGNSARIAHKLASAGACSEQFGGILITAAMLLLEKGDDLKESMSNVEYIHKSSD